MQYRYRYRQGLANTNHVAGGPKEVWDTSELAKRVHDGRYTDTTEERNGGCTQPKTCSATRRYLFLDDG